MKPVLLIVDDNKDILDFLADDLGEKYEVLAASSGPEALTLLKNNCVQLIISDIMMPGMDGFTLCRTIKNDFEHSHLPIILLTAKNTMESRIEGLELGADAYVEKPFSPQYLQVQVANLLQNRSKLRDYFANSPLTHIKSMAHTRHDEQFLEHLHEVISDNLDQEELDVKKIATIMNMSRPTFYRKLKSISNLTPNELLNITRLKKAAALLAEGNYKVYEVSEIVGFGSPNHFGRSFMKQFGMSPTAYVQEKLGEIRGG